MGPPGVAASAIRTVTFALCWINKAQDK